MAIDERMRTPGIWYFTERMTSAESVEFAQRVESLGYSALWLPEATGRNPLVQIAHLSAHTTDLVFATGIANIFHRHPGMMKQSAWTLAELTGGRFVLGIGVSHAPIVADMRGLDYRRPLAQMRAYLDAMLASPYTAASPAEDPKVVIAALGPRMLELAAEKTDGAHPYWTTPEHTARAREILGPDKWLCVEQKVVLSTDAEAARAAANGQIDNYAGLPNYRNNWKRLGFTDDEIDQRADRLVDALVAWGTADDLRARVQAHYDAGASHVCIQPVRADGAFGRPDWTLLEALAPAA